MPTAKAIIAEVARSHRLTALDITGRSRQLHLIPPRHQAMAMIRSELGYSYPRIGRIFGRDHTTIMHGVKRYAERSARQDL